MKDTALFTQILGLGAPWRITVRITAITPNLTDKSMTIQIDWAKGTKGACSTCNALCSAFGNKTQAANLLGLSWDEVHHIQSRAVKRGMDRRSVETVQKTNIRRSCESRNPVK